MLLRQPVQMEFSNFILALWGSLHWCWPTLSTYKSQMIGYYPEIILSGRRINDSIGEKIIEN